MGSRNGADLRFGIATGRGSEMVERGLFDVLWFT